MILWLKRDKIVIQLTWDFSYIYVQKSISQKRDSEMTVLDQETKLIKRENNW